MSATIPDRKERLSRRIALVHEFGVDRLRELYGSAKRARHDRPIVCVFHVSAGGGYNALKALKIDADQEAVVLPFADVMEVASKCSMHDLVDTLNNRLERDQFAVLCIAWDGWTLFYPDRPGGMNPRPYERLDEAPPPSEPEPSSRPN